MIKIKYWYNKFGGRKFTAWMMLVIISSVALFFHLGSLAEWGVINVPLFGVLCGFNVYQKKIEGEK